MDSLKPQSSLASKNDISPSNLVRNVTTTRIRDFYDIYELWRVKGDTVDRRIFGKALAATCEKRNSWKAVEHRKEAINAMRKDDGLERQWEAYVSKHSYTVGISFQETLNVVWNILESSPLQGD